MRTAPRTPLALVAVIALTTPLAWANPEEAAKPAAPAAKAAASNSTAASPATGARVMLSPAGASSLTMPRGPALAAALKTKRMKLIEFKDLSLKDLATWLRVATGWNWIVNQSALAKADVDPAALSFSADFEDLSIATLLEVLFEPHGLALRVQDSLIWITSHADAQGKLLTRVYGISHLTWTKIDFAAPEINLRPSDFTAEEVEPETVVENDPFNSGEGVAELLKEVVASGEWATEGWEMRATNNHLVVRAPAAVHAKIPGALETIAGLK